MIVQLIATEGGPVLGHGHVDVSFRADDGAAKIVFSAQNIQCKSSGELGGYLILTDDGQPWFYIPARAHGRLVLQAGNSVKIEDLTVHLEGVPLPKPRYSLDVNDAIMEM